METKKILNKICVFLFSIFQLAATAATDRSVETADQEQATPHIRIGSKKFTENVTLGYLAEEILKDQGLFKTTHQEDIGSTRVLWKALINGDIDVYPEYTGTLFLELIREPQLHTWQELSDFLKAQGLGITQPLGFNNTYAMGMRKKQAEDLRITKVSDLRRFPNMTYGMSEEFSLRPDGWLELTKIYQIKTQAKQIRILDPDLAYRALATGDIDVFDLLSTDPEIEYYDFVTLNDDLHFFPEYKALFLYRLETAEQNPDFLKALKRLEGKISNSDMIKMNMQAKMDKIPSPRVAKDFLLKKGLLTSNSANNKTATQNSSEYSSSGERWARLWQRTQEHLQLCFFSLLPAIFISLPLGLFCSRRRRWGSFILGSVAVIQTIPALALLVLLIRPLHQIGLSGIGPTPAMIALFLYSLLPILRNTASGFSEIPTPLLETAEVLNISPLRRLLRIELPLALPYIWSGIKTATVLNIGFATLGALIGAGGYGQSILAGIRLDDDALILEGAIPSALLALLAQKLIGLFEARSMSHPASAP